MERERTRPWTALDAASAGIVPGLRLCGADVVGVSDGALRLWDMSSETVNYQAQIDVPGWWRRLQAFFGFEEAVVVPSNSSWVMASSGFAFVSAILW